MFLIHTSNNTDTDNSSAVLITIYLVKSITSALWSECLQMLPNSLKDQGELHYIYITMLKSPHTGKSRLVLEAV